MIGLNVYHIIGFIAAMAIIVGLSVSSVKNVKNAADFASGGGKTSAVIISGVIMGTLVGGSSTVGTAQLAYNYGMSAWWFTLGGGIACLVLALGFIKPLRRAGQSTLVSIVAKEFGATAGKLSSVLSSIGIFINIISQLISGTAVIAVIAPSLGMAPALAITAALMAVYVIFGGVKATGLVGVVKLVLLYIAMVGGGIMVLVLSGGWGPFIHMVQAIEPAEGAQAVNYFSLFARGVGKDAGAGLALVFGVLTTQTYAQAVMSGRTDAAARRGALISTFLIPPIGIGGILVGLYMRANYPGIVAKTALTGFVLEHMPPLLGGVVLATLLIAVVGTGAGLALGITAIIDHDIVKPSARGLAKPRQGLLFNRVCIVVILALASCLSTGALGDTILNFAFMSMALRGAVVLAPLSGALWFPGRVDCRFAVAAIIVGPLVVLAGNFVSKSFDPLFIGIAAAILLCLIGALVKRKATR